MCASYGLETSSALSGLEVLDERRLPSDVVEWLRRPPPVVRPTGRHDRSLAPIVTRDGVELAWWGLWVGAAPASFSTINARVEKLTAGLWKRPLEQDRVLVPATRYFEYRDEGGKRKVRYSFQLPRERPFAFAGVAAPVFGEGLPRRSYAIVTREPTPAAAEIHNRMPLLLPLSFHAEWLDPATAGDQALLDAAVAASEEIVGELSWAPAALIAEGRQEQPEGWQEQPKE